MKNIFKLILFVAILGFAGNANAQKFGHINFAELYSIMPGQDTAQAQYEQYARGLQAQMENMQKELETKFLDYQTNMATMSEIIKQTKEKEIQDLQARIEAFNMSATQDLQAKEAQLTQPLIERAKKAVQDVAKANGFTYIFNSSEGLLLYSEPSDNIMPLVKKQLGL